MARSLAALPFAAFRALVRERFARVQPRALPEEISEVGSMDREAAAVHIWGPVMVLPYAGPNETLQTLELLARDAGAASVSVIVVDLGGAIIDDAFGAMALEQLVQTVEGWGAEVLFVDPSPLSERVLADLDHPPLLIEKDSRRRSPSRSRSRARSADWYKHVEESAGGSTQAAKRGPREGVQASAGARCTGGRG